ncbi:MAG: signal peptidase II [candidate division WOR-3 bacterium]|nr:MAG: signal peptidase II [candidate division WOR-3 bacterium]
MVQQKSVRPILLFAFISFTLDQLTKLYVVNYLSPMDPPAEIIGSLLRLKLTFNPYGVFGLSIGPAALNYVLTVIGIIVLFYVGLTLKDRTGLIVFGLLIGGALGNVADRLRFGYVIDFIDMGIGNLRWFTYNLADAFITVGAVFLLVREILFKKKTQ